jgi:hypothetical protein
MPRIWDLCIPVLNVSLVSVQSTSPEITEKQNSVAGDWNTYNRGQTRARLA